LEEEFDFVFPCQKNKNKTWSLVSNSSLSKTFALGSLKPSSSEALLYHFVKKILSLKKIVAPKKILGLKNFWVEKKFGVRKFLLVQLF